MNNPFQLFQAMRNPQQFVQNMMNNQQVMQNPIIRNAMDMYKCGDKSGLTKIAENLCQTNGKDFNSEFNNFKNNLKL